MIAPLVVLGIVSSLAPPNPAPDVLLLPHAELETRLGNLGRTHPALATAIPVGTSRGGRSITALRIAPAARVDDPGRPAILVVANVDGPQVFGSALALHHAEALLEGYGRDAEVTALLDGATLYVIPRANPDAAEARFQTPLFEREASGHGVDNDRDDRLGEDGPADVDGDGSITWMRVPDPEGAYIADPHDPRAHREADPLEGERGRWKIVREGRDLDGDGEASEDPPHDAVFNANFAAGWPELQPHGGRFPTDEPGVRALCDFVIERPEIALVVCYGAQDNLVGGPRRAGDGGGRVPPPGWLPDDADALAVLGELYRDQTDNTTEASADDAGSFQRWCYEHRGIWTLAIHPWTMPTEAPAPEEGADGGAGPGEAADDDPAPGDAREEAQAPPGEPTEDAGRLAWIDATGETQRFVAWRAFEHPELGPVEIGGFAPFARVEPPRAEWAERARAEFGFVRSLGAHLPRVALESVDRENVAANVWRVTAVVRNDGPLPYASAAALRARTVLPIRVELTLPDDATLLAGRPRTTLSSLDGHGGRQEIEWIVAGPSLAGLAVDLITQHAGVERREESR